MDILNQALSECSSLVGLKMNERIQYLSVHYNDIVQAAVKQSAQPANVFFITVVRSSGTYNHIITHADSALNPVPPEFVENIGSILRYGKAIGDVSGLELSSCAPMTFLYYTVRKMCAAGFGNRKLFLTFADRFAEFVSTLRRMDSCLDTKSVGGPDTTTLISALVDIILFCGQVTKFMEGAKCLYLS